MNPEQTLSPFEQLQKQAYKNIIRANYTQAASFYEQAITTQPEIKSHYWYLGLVLLLQGQEVEAQTTWLMAMMDGDAEQVEEWTAQLSLILQEEASRRESVEEYATGWTLRQQIREICPTDIENLLKLLQLALKLETYTGEELTDFRVLELLKGLQIAPNWDLLMSVLQSVLNYAPHHPTTLELAEICVESVSEEAHGVKCLNILLPAAVEIAFAKKLHLVAIFISELALRLDPKNSEVLRHLSAFYQYIDEYKKGIEAAELQYSVSEELTKKIPANLALIRALMAAGGHWDEACAAVQRQKLLLEELVELQPMELEPITVSRCINSSFFFPYFQDSPQEFRTLQNQVSQLCQANIETYDHERVKKYREGHRDRKQKRTINKPLKIGYVSHCFRNHSVGWLARWLMQHHDRERFEINGYFVICDPISYEPLHQWYLGQFSQVFKSKSVWETAEKIYEDEIDILIDLDSITLDLSSELMMRRPAPIQVTWLGWDASGIPNVDYFIADPYVLPNSAQEYYVEKIWRLPQTYIAVDGFEVGIPTLRREHLEIANDAVIYLSGQKGYKRHPDTVRLQMQIIKEVPNSYFLIKGGGDKDSIKSLFIQIADEVGVDSNRLRFLKSELTEASHRANLGIADIVLDTFPYNGATTTLEVLWMGIPMVTKVGEQFAARNSYTMMKNAGISEGIAWTDQEYVEWGIRLGKEEALRQKVAWKLHQSRQTSPLWKGKEFTQEMENAYEQMWEKYIKNELADH